MKITISLKIFAILLFIHGIVSGQRGVLYESFSKREGIDIKDIKSIVEDQNGFVWIAGEKLEDRAIINSTSNNFIQRFDGQRFRPIQLEGIDSSHVLEYLHLLPGNRLSIHTSSKKGVGLFYFDIDTFKITPIDLKGAVFVSRIFNFDHQSYILTQTVNNRIVLNTIDKSGSLQEVFTFSTLAVQTNLGQSVNLIKVDGNWIVSGNHFPIMIISPVGEVLHSYPASALNRTNGVQAKKLWIREKLFIDQILYAFIDDSGTLYKYNPVDYLFRPTDINFDNKENDKTVKIFKDPTGNNLIGVVDKNNFSLYKFKDENITQIVANVPLKNVTALQLYSSQIDDHLWMATNNGEVFYFKFPPSQFGNLLPDKQLRAIQKLEGQQYIIATEKDGWYIFNESNNDIKPFPLKEDGKPIKANSSRNFIIQDTTIWSCTKGSIVEVSKNTGVLKSYRNYPATSLINVDDSLLIYGTNKYYLMQFNKITKSHEKLINTDTLFIQDVALDPSINKVFAATDKGLLIYDRNNKKTEFIKSKFKDPYLLMVDYNQVDGFLIGSRNGYVYQYNSIDNSFDLFYEDALKAGIATITKDKDTYWISTFNGLVHYDPIQKTSKRYSVKDGLSNNEGNRYSALKTYKGILIGSLVGLNYFDPAMISSSNYLSQLELFKIRYFDKEKNDFKDLYSDSAFAKARNINLPAENRSLELEFALSHVDPLRGETYKYRMNDGTWQELENRTYLKFNNLNAGNYKLDLQAVNYSGVEVPGMITLQITVDDFFYKTWWFLLLLLLVVLSIVTYIIQQSNFKRKSQEKYSQDLIANREEERKRIAKELHDSVGQQLTLIKQTAQSNSLVDLARMTNTTLEEVRSISRGLYPASLKQLGLTASIEQLLLDVDEQTDLFVSVSIDKVDAVFNNKESLNIYRFIQEAVSNVLKHAQAKAIEVYVEHKGEVVTIKVIDNGKGFDVNKFTVTKSLGLKTLKERIKIIKGTFTIESVPNKQTTLKAIIPLNNAR